VGDLNQDAGAIAGAGIAAAGAAVGQVDENLDAFDDDVVRLLALDVGETKPMPQASCSRRGS
jgi:hypothetical protein